MYPVYGLAEASLAVSFPPPGAPMRTITLNRHGLGVGNPGGAHRQGLARRGAARVGRRARFRIAMCASPTTRTGRCRRGGSDICTCAVTTLLAATTRTPRSTPRPSPPTGGCVPATWHSSTGDLYVSGRAKEIIFVNGQNYYPHDLEAIAQRIGGLELGKVVAAGVGRRAPRSSS